MEFTLDYASLAKKLETQELESPTREASAQVYGQLLAIYLLLNDLTTAKLLWKRIPERIRAENGELSLIWSVGKLIWNKNYADVHRTINSYSNWPNHLKNIMKLIQESSRQRAIDLISKAYSSIHVAEASRILGITELEVLELAQSQPNWSYEQETRFIIIERKIDDKPPVQHHANNGTELLKKLTDYIIFLESTN